MKKYFLILTLCHLAFGMALHAQGNFQNFNGAHIICQDNPVFILNNINLQNEGFFEESASTIALMGQEVLQIESDIIFPFHNLLIETGTEVHMNYHTDVKGNLLLANGIYNIGNHILTLDPSSKIYNENSSDFITSDVQGYMTIGEVIQPLTFQNPGNLGVVFISSGNDLDYTEVRRGHLSHPLPSGSSSYRWYQIMPNNNENLFAYLRFYYLDHELAGLNENDLIIWRSNDHGQSWFPIEPANRDLSENWIEIFESNDLAMYTFGEVGGIGLQANTNSNIQNQENLKFNTYPNPATNLVNIALELEQTLTTEVIILNAIGQSVYQSEYSLEKGSNQFEIDVNNWPSGVYFIQLAALDISASFIKK